MKHFSMSANFSDYPDSSKMAVSVFLPGCHFNCIGCHNAELQNEDYIGDQAPLYAKDIDDLVKQIQNYARRNRTNHIALMGGDPLHKSNIEITKQLCDKLYYDNFRIIVYTGYAVEYVPADLKFTYLKCGTYNINMKQDSKLTDDNFILASTNQKIYDQNFKLLSNNGIFNWNI